MTKAISTEYLKKKIDGKEKIYVIDVLSPESFEARHLPAAINIPRGPEFVKEVKEAGIGKDDKIVVYCSSATCASSPAAAAALEKAGFKYVVDYQDGLAGWQEAGYEFERKLTGEGVVK